MKKILVVFLTLLTVPIISCQTGYTNHVEEGEVISTESSEGQDNHEYIQRLEQKIKETLSYASSNGFSQKLAILVDMRKPDTLFRIYLVDLRTKTILKRGLVAHGHCGSYSLDEPKFSNKPGSNCSSLGKFKIGAKYYGNFGLAYKLHGLDSTNSAAFERFIVLHAHSCIPDEETWGWICQSEGCPTVSPNFLDEVSPKIDAEGSPLLLNIFY